MRCAVMDLASHPLPSICMAGFQIYCDPEQQEVVIDDEWMNE